jgi:hypothetical protein
MRRTPTTESMAIMKSRLTWSVRMIGELFPFHFAGLKLC